MIGRKNCHAFVNILAGQRSKSFKIVDDGFLSPLRHHLSTYVKPMFPLIFIHTCKKMGLPSPHQLCICCLTRMQGGNQIFLIECCAARATKWPRSPYTYQYILHQRGYQEFQIGVAYMFIYIYKNLFRHFCFWPSGLYGFRAFGTLGTWSIRCNTFMKQIAWQPL